VDAIAAVVSKMVEQRKAMQEKMSAMHMEMMKNKMTSPTPGMH